MKHLISKVKNLSINARRSSNMCQFLDNAASDPTCHSMFDRMREIQPSQLGITGPQDPYHFQENLNRVTICGNEDYRLVLFFIKQGTVMPLHDHPNMSVFFRVMFGKLKYISYDKIDSKFKYNDFSADEYAEILHKKQVIKARKTRQFILE